jgi:hypothetical protein
MDWLVWPHYVEIPASGSHRPAFRWNDASRPLFERDDSLVRKKFSQIPKIWFPGIKLVGIGFA